MGTDVSALSPSKNSGSSVIQSMEEAKVAPQIYSPKVTLFLEKEEDSYFKSLAHLFLSCTESLGF